jgi:hypothetical protein
MGLINFGITIGLLAVKDRAGCNTFVRVGKPDS